MKVEGNLEQLGSNSFLMVYQWFLDGFCGFAMVFLMVVLWFPYGFTMVSLWFSNGFTMVFNEFSHGFP